MKKVIGLLLCICLLFNTFAPPVLAIANKMQPIENTTEVEEESTEVEEETTKVEEETTEVEEKTTKVEEKTIKVEEKTIKVEDETTEVEEKTTELEEDTTEVEEKTTKVEEKTTELKKENVINIEPQNDIVKTESQIYELGVFEATGNLEIDVKFVLPINNIENPNVGIKLIDQSGNVQNIDFNGITVMQALPYSLGDQKGEIAIRKISQEGDIINGIDDGKVKYYSVTIYNLKKGDYSLELYGNGYKTYSVNHIKLDDYAKRVSISNENGMFEVGDVNQDGKIDNTDVDEIIQHVDSINNDDLIKYDLNRDKKIDIIDIAMIASSINGNKQSVNIEDTSAIIDFANIKVEGIIEGEVENIFQSNGNSIIIKPLDDTKDISEDNAAVISINMAKTIKMSQIRLEAGSENIPEEVTLEVTDENNAVKTYKGRINLPSDVHFFTDQASENTIVIDLEGQIAVKKVTIKITKTSSKKLSEIAKVEFLNNVYEEVPVPEIEIPKNVSVDVSSESATVKYSNLRNVTGYEILVRKMDGDQIVAYSTYQTEYTSYVIKGLKNYTTYQVLVRAVNGEWKSNYSDPVSFTPLPKRLPPSVESVKLTSVISGFNISYKKMDDTLTYNIYYRKSGENDFKKIEGINGTSYQLRELEESKEYQIYITGNNHLGEGAASQTVVGTTKKRELPDNNKYSLLNISNGVGNLSAHIKSVMYKNNKYGSSEIALVDNDYNSYWQADTWDTGGYNVTTISTGPVFEFDDNYKIDHIIVVPKEETSSFFYASLTYWQDNKQVKTGRFKVSSSTSPNGQKYYILKFSPITTNKIQINLANYSASGNIAMTEVQFYKYDSLEDDVAALFLDDLRVELKEEVTLSMIEELETRANTPDENTNDYHPNKETILRELNYAKEILNDTNIKNVMIVDQNINNSKHVGFSSLSDLQPLGISARSGETITVYVGTQGSTMPQVVFTQYYAESSAWKQTVVNLKKGQNIIKVPQLTSSDVEKGGPVYIRYPKSTTDKEIKIRVSGGTEIPYLDIHNLTDESEIKEAISIYIKNLKDYTEQLPSKYSNEGKEFKPSTSVLNATEIATKNGLFSVAATKAYSGIKTGLTTEEEQVNRLYNSLVAFEEMMNLFYRHKGLSEDAIEAIDKTPSSRINIRYMRMFDGAFMYASGDHIGIGYNSITGLMQGRPNQIVDGEITTSGYFGWGISHEIGHQINQGNLVHAEVTNNVYSLLAQTNDDKKKARIEDRYNKIYQKVTSGIIGKSSDVFVTLGMYWQLHLAYDDNKTATDTNSIYARINRLSRRSKLSGYSKDDLLVIFASEASGKDLTEFFEKWGIIASTKAKNYINEKSLEKETRPIWYLNDAARRYRLNGGAIKNENTTVSAELSKIDNQNKQYTLTFNVDQSEDAILGYEIKRNGVPIMFTTAKKFTDVIGALNNQAITYEVTAYDKYLNPTNTVILDEVKVSYDGSINKNNFDISSNFKMKDEIIDYENPEIDSYNSEVYKLIDNDVTTSFNGTERMSSSDKTVANIIINMNTTMDISGIKYQAATENGNIMSNSITKYNVYVSQDSENWILAKSGTFNLNANNNYTNTIYFDKKGTTGGNQLWTYSDISYIKIEAVGNKNGISGAEIDIICPPGDNVDISNTTIGILKDDYKYKDSEGKDETIKKGSIVFKGDYRGNPAFNVVLLVDAKTGTPFSGDNFLFASLNNEGDVYEINKGFWFYVVDKEIYEEMKNTSIRAELYRVDNALTNDGQRLTSTSLAISNLPEYDKLPFMEIVDSTKGA